jgi:hypothetical protein
VTLEVRPPPGRAIIRGPGLVRALVSGPRRELLKLSTTPLHLSRMLSDTTEGDRVRLELSPGELEVPRGVSVQVQDLEPRAVTLELDSTFQRVVPVEPMVHLRSDLGFSLDGISVVPGTVRLLGPKDRLSRIDSVRTETLQVTSADAPMEASVELDTTNFGAVRVQPHSVVVRVDVEAISERTFSDIPVRLSSTAAMVLHPDREQVMVRVRGPASRLAALAADSVVVLAETGKPQQPGKVALRVFVPAGFSARAEPDSVELSRRSDRG